MAWSFVGSANSPTTNAVTRSVTAGNLLIVLVETGASGDAPAIQAGSGNTWTLIETVADTGNNNHFAWWYAIAAATASITVTIGGTVTGAYEGLQIGEWTSSNGAVASSPLDGTPTHNLPNPGSAATNGDVSGSLTTTQAGDLIVSWVSDTSAAATGATRWTAGTSPNAFTKRFTLETLNNGTTCDNPVEDFVQTSAGAIQGTWTRGTTAPYACFVVAFKEPAGGPPPVPTVKLALARAHRARPFAPGLAR